MYLEELSDKIWATKNARFTASRRMHRNKISSVAAVSMLSASIIAINLFAFLPNKNCDTNFSTYITLSTIVLSVFTLVISALINQLDYANRENNFHRCGIDLDMLNQQIKISIAESQIKPEIEKETNDQFLSKYKNILTQYNLNHTPFDDQYSRYIVERKKYVFIWKECLHYKNLRYYLRSIKYFVRWNIWDVYILYWMIAIIPIVGIIYYFFVTIACH